MLFYKRAQQVHIIAYPELQDCLLASPGMAVEVKRHLAIVVVLRVCHALFDRVEVDVQVESLADLLADFRYGGGRLYECEAGIKEDCLEGLWLFKRHEHLFALVIAPDEYLHFSY